MAPYSASPPCGGPAGDIEEDLLVQAYRRRLLPLLVLAALLAVLAACGAEATPTPTPRPATPTPIPATPTPLPPTATPTRVPPTPTPIPTGPTATPRPGTTPVPATATPTPAAAVPTATSVPATATPKPKSLLPGLPPTNTISDADWAKIVEAAKKEGSVTCYCWLFATWQDKWVRDSFKAATGIEVELMRFSGTITVERIKTEARAGKYIADIYNAMASYHTDPIWQGTGLLKRIDNLPALKEARDPDKWYFNPLLTTTTLVTPTGLKIGGSNYNYHVDLLPPERLPKKHQDLLDPWFKGKICQTDPITSAGPDYHVWRFFREWGYPEWWPEFVWQYFNKSDRFYGYIMGSANPLYAGNCVLNISWTAGSAGLLKGIHLEDKATWIKSGNFDPPKPVGIANDQGLSLTAKSPHPNAALVFLNWMMSKEGQEAWAKAGYGSVARRDVASLVEPKYYPDKPVTTFWLTDLEWYTFEQYSYASKGVFNLMKQGMTKDAWVKWTKDTSMNFWGQYPPPLAEFFKVE